MATSDVLKKNAQELIKGSVLATIGFNIVTAYMGNIDLATSIVVSILSAIVINVINYRNIKSVAKKFD
jgi:hypothetical protein